LLSEKEVEGALLQKIDLVNIALDIGIAKKEYEYLMDFL
jgi:hypothetical protein